jgi:hypothetical protein
MENLEDSMIYSEDISRNPQIPHHRFGILKYAPSANIGLSLNPSFITSLTAEGRNKTNIPALIEYQ